MRREQTCNFKLSSAKVTFFSFFLFVMQVAKNLFLNSITVTQTNSWGFVIFLLLLQIQLCVFHQPITAHKFTAVTTAAGARGTSAQSHAKRLVHTSKQTEIIEHTAQAPHGPEQMWMTHSPSKRQATMFKSLYTQSWFTKGAHRDPKPHTAIQSNGEHATR